MQVIPNVKDKLTSWVPGLACQLSRALGEAATPVSSTDSLDEKHCCQKPWAPEIFRKNVLLVGTYQHFRGMSNAFKPPPKSVCTEENSRGLCDTHFKGSLTKNHVLVQRYCEAMPIHTPDGLSQIPSTLILGSFYMMFIEFFRSMNWACCSYSFVVL